MWMLIEKIVNCLFMWLILLLS